MMETTKFTRLFDDIAGDLDSSMTRAARAGVARDAILIDPCVGFGKDARQSAALVASSQWLEARLGRPVLIGASRKRFLGDITGRPVQSRDLASVAAAMVAVECGATIVRVHDVLATLEALRVRAEVLSAREAVGNCTS
jgi:dihydropteroate synthase